MGYKFGIPSYKRSDGVDTLKLLKSMGYRKEDIVISTQTRQDYEAYTQAYGKDAQIIYRQAFNVGQNRNTLIDHFGDGEEFIMLDDDVRSFCHLDVVADKKILRKITNKSDLESVFAKMFAYAEYARSPMFAWYPVANAFFLRDSVDKRNIFVGTILGVKNDKRIKFDETYDLKEDFEISLRLMRLGYNAVRFNGYTVQAKHISKGGCEDARKRGRNANRCAALIERYPDLVKPHPSRTDEVKFIGNRR